MGQALFSVKNCFFEKDGLKLNLVFTIFISFYPFVASRSNAEASSMVSEMAKWLNFNLEIDTIPNFMPEIIFHSGFNQT